ncbi:hypothetical protein SLE2022_252830 [Rubroshorea leprosula]
MAQNKLFSAVFIFLALIFVPEIQSVEGRHLKFLSEKPNTHKRFLARETEKCIKGESIFHAVYVQSPPPAVKVGASELPPARHVDEFWPAGEKGIERECSFHAADVQSSPPPAAAIGASEPPPARHVDDFRPAAPDHNPCNGCHYIEAAHANTAFSNEEKADPLPPPPPYLNHPIHH